jgi:hypothetical protein
LVGDFDDCIDAFTHADQDRVSAGRDDGEPVGVRHGHRRARDPDPERGVPARVDDPQPDPLTRAHPDHLGRAGQPPVGEVVGVDHVPGVPAEQVRAGHRHSAHATHVAHLAVVHPVHPAHAVGEQVGQHGVGVAPRTVEPVVEHDDELAVVVARLVGVLHDQRRVQPTVELDPDVRVEHVGARVGHRELVAEGGPGRHLWLGEHGHPVHVVAQRQAVPMHGGRLGKVVGEVHLEQVTAADPDLRPGDLTPVAPGLHLPTAEIDRARRGGQRDLAGGLPGAAPGVLDLVHARSGRADPHGGRRARLRCARGDRHSERHCASCHQEAAPGQHVGRGTPSTSTGDHARESTYVPSP